MSGAIAVEELLRKIAAELSRNRAHLNAKRHIEDDSGCPIDRVAFIMAIEAEFGIEIPDDEARRINTLDDALRCVQARQQGVS